MNTEQVRSLSRECASPEERTNHIYLDVLILQDYLEHQQGEPNP